MRDDFSLKTKETLAKRVAFKCSNPGCRQGTSGPQSDPSKSVNIGVAAHITAASADGPRYDPSLTAKERESCENGIWLCQNCAKLVDNDPDFYDEELLGEWKRIAEMMADREIKHRRDHRDESIFVKLEQLMPDLLDEMRNDLRNSPVSRELIVLGKGWVYNGGGVLRYYYEDHADLENKLHILENHGLVRDITFNNTLRYVISEQLADYLTQS